MAKQLENATTVVHFPLRPFGRHAGQREIVLTYGGPDVNADEIPPLNGCTLDDPLSDSDKARLCALSLARIDAGGRFDVDYAALRAYLRSLCGVRDEDLHGLTWATIMDILRPKAALGLTSETPAGALPVNEGQMSGEARAVGVLAQHPDWTDKQVARAAGVHPKSLYRYQRFKIARGALKDSGQSDLPRGFKTDDGDIEAYE